MLMISIIIISSDQGIAEYLNSVPYNANSMIISALTIDHINGIGYPKRPLEV